MSEVKRFDHVNHAHIDDCEHVESSEGAWVTASDYDALAAKLTMAEDAAAKGDAARQQCGGMEMEIEELRAELAELRARVVVVPGRKGGQSTIPGLHRNRGWNACLDELARINGMTVSEGLLRLTLEFIMATNYKGSIPLGLIEELRALLNQDKENGNG
ncbi:hypothetical protein IPC1486_22780 [Pseudomonas aeruginosa]|uniref:hypothetical protein n=1 Tax=Pseudomonas aeruginosa TaxID=287 RepID=UPI0010677B41|nr:hypothetical protein [Pseudomonas aeruginosa]TEF22098.1 hypothetical protein IPC1486_22780 [Pseudomonas aeruginosa]TEF29660.1 hypothetical protein IPC1485_17625 [Pseudomonas aeruginosa]